MNDLQSENSSLRDELLNVSEKNQQFISLFSNFATFSDSFDQLQHSLDLMANSMKEEKLSAIRGSEISTMARGSVETMTRGTEKVGN